MYARACAAFLSGALCITVDKLLDNSVPTSCLLILSVIDERGSVQHPKLSVSEAISKLLTRGMAQISRKCG